MVDSAISPAMIQEKIHGVLNRIAESARISGRAASDVTLVAVSKFHPLQQLLVAAESGITAFGENRVQEAQEKKLAWDGAPVAWHLIGNLQRNKVRKALELFDTIQSVDSLLLAGMMNRVLEEEQRPPFPVLIEINYSGEASKKGIAPETAESLITGILRDHPRIAVQGAMTIAPQTADNSELHKLFSGFRTLIEKLRVQTGLSLPDISMGMSQDYEIAIQEGSTLVRVGTAIFGART